MTLEPGDSAAAAGAAPRGCQFKRETARAAGEVDAAASLGCGEQTVDRTRGPAGDGGGADGAVGSEVPAPLAASTRAPDAGPAPSTEIAPEIAADGADPEILREDRDGGADGADGAETPEDSVKSSSEKGTPGAGVCPANRAATANSEGAGEVRLPQTAQGAKAFTIDGRAVPDVDESIVDFHPNGTLRSQRELEVLVPEEYKTASGMVPRSYQLELFQRALRGNCIAVLDTGSGKTFVAVLLVKHMFSEELVRRKSTKQVVHQQARVLRANTPAVVRELSGGMDLDLESWNVEMWQMEFEVTDIFVCTPHVLLSMLRKAFMMMEKVGCFAGAVNGLYRAGETDLELEQNLSARVFTATRGEDVLQFMYRPEEDVIRYAAPRKYEACESPLYEELVAKLSRISNSKVKRMLSDADWTFKNLGPWAGTHVLVTALRDTEVNTLDKLPSSVSNKGGNKAESGEDEGASRWRKEGPNVNPFTEEEMKYLHEAIDTRDSRPELAPRMNENSLSPKLMTVLKVLQSFSLVPEFRGRIFYGSCCSLCFCRADMQLAE
ncbi:MAG: hypothetical protein BJ554DRAFT_715 [Olpidium bornovanus]|uniref:Helicase ATP-binding domain-containing protein n=1 Tax=Olpidium bornovanus TaxID=278681 RepID=A0A8H8A1N5_9FUNG|nr:MAG: hypothetical protein BJ554DRAFT_715 [Olpidium bornovanus]